jgi:hypothetical protein
MGADAAVLVFAFFGEWAALIKNKEEVVDVAKTLELEELVLEMHSSI